MIETILDLPRKRFKVNGAPKVIIGLILMLIGSLPLFTPNWEHGGSDVAIYGAYVKTFPHGFDEMLQGCLGCRDDHSEIIGTNNSVHPRHILHQPLSALIYHFFSGTFDVTAYGALRVQNILFNICSVVLFFIIYRKLGETELLSLAKTATLFLMYPLLYFASSGENYPSVFFGCVLLLYFIVFPPRARIMLAFLLLSLFLILIHTLIFPPLLIVVAAVYALHRKGTLLSLEFLLLTLVPLCLTRIVLFLCETFFWSKFSTPSDRLHHQFTMGSMDVMNKVVLELQLLPRHLGTAFVDYRLTWLPMVIGSLIILAMGCFIFLTFYRSLKNNPYLMPDRKLNISLIAFSAVFVGLICAYQATGASNYYFKFWFLLSPIILFSVYRVIDKLELAKKICVGLLLGFSIINLCYFITSKVMNQEYFWATEIHSLDLFPVDNDDEIYVFGDSYDLPFFFFNNTNIKRVFSKTGNSILEPTSKLLDPFSSGRINTNRYFAFQYSDEKSFQNIKELHRLDIIFEDNSRNFAFARIGS